MTIPEPHLIGERVTVRLARSTDAREVVRFYRDNARHLSRYETPRPEAFQSVAFWRREIPRRRRAHRQDRSTRCFVFDSTGEISGRHDAVLGSAALSTIVRGTLHGATLGYAIDKEFEGRGLMHASVGLLLHFAFRDMNLHRVAANYSPRNLRSARVLERLGFVVEGYARQYLLVNGRWEDHVLTACTNPAWRPPPGTTMRSEDGRIVPVPDGGPP